MNIQSSLDKKKVIHITKQFVNQYLNKENNSSYIMKAILVDIFVGVLSQPRKVKPPKASTIDFAHVNS